MPRFSRRNNRRSTSKKVITRRKKNRFTRKYGVKNGVKNGGSGPAMVILKNEPLVWSFKTN
jgi:hypothetical protein